MSANSHSSSPAPAEPTEETFTASVISRTFTTASFGHEDTKITNIALAASIEYLRMFTREAVWRAEQASREEQDTKSLASGSNDHTNPTGEAKVELQPGHGVLEARHLESVAGTLVMDF